MRRLQACGLGAVALVLTACTEDPSQPTPATNSDEVRTVATLTDGLPGEQAFVKLSAAAPTSAGFYFEDDVLNVVVTDESQAAHAILALERLIGSEEIHIPRSTRAILAVEGEYSYAQLALWRNQLSDRLFNEMDVATSLDLDEVSNGIIVGVNAGELEVLRPALAAAVDELGIPSTAVVYREDNWVPDVAAFPSSLRGNADTLVGGIEVFYPDGGQWWACSLGFAADYYGSPAVVTASHCSPTMYWPDESPLHQGDTLSSRYLGWEYMDPAGSSCGLFDTCRATDAALYYVNGALPAEVGKIARTQYRSHSSDGSLTWDTSNPYFIVRAESGSLFSGYQVNKMGRSAGWTYGSITGTCVTIDYGDERVTCGYEATYYSEGGDSGGAIFMWDGGGEAVSLSGVHSGQNTSTGKRFFSRLADIETELGAMTTAKGATLTAPTLGGSVSGSLRLQDQKSVAMQVIASTRPMGRTCRTIVTGCTSA